MGSWAKSANVKLRKSAPCRRRRMFISRTLATSRRQSPGTQAPLWLTVSKSSRTAWVVSSLYTHASVTEQSRTRLMYQLRSTPAVVTHFLQRRPVERYRSSFGLVQLLGTVTDALQCCASL